VHLRSELKLPIGLVITCLVLALSLAGGQILFKYAALDIQHRAEQSWLSAVLSPWLISSILVYALSTVLWIWILARAPLTKAYPFALAGAAFVPLLAYFLFNEPLSIRYFIGAAAVLLGIFIIQMG
jgi:drug/metabolite transporter (DMT)-like permease